LKPIQRLYLVSSTTSRDDLVNKINEFLKEYLLSNPTHEIANIVNSNTGSEAMKKIVYYERNEKTQTKQQITVWEMEYWAVITILENLHNDDPKRINLLS
jgi:hypothetical protein